VIASLELPYGNVEEVRVCYLCGCDGAHSTVREGIKVGFAGGSSPQRLFVADVCLTGERSEGEIDGFLGEESFYGIFPMPGESHARLVGLLPEYLPPDSEVTFEALRPDVESLCKVTVHTVQWFSTYRVHHRVAEHFRKGRIFLVGDAAHIHSPAGGQGMNTGIGDAVNLAWKLAEVLSHDRNPEILETYEAERIPFAKTLVQTTDRFFRGVTNPTRMSKILRLRVIPSVVSVATRFPVVRRQIFRLLSQILINYRDSSLSLGRTGRLWAGDRLPWIPMDDGKTNYNPLVTLDWQIHAYGNLSSEVQTCAGECDLPVHQLPYNDAARRFGIQRNAVYLVRPDGHIGCALGSDDVSLLRQYWPKLSESVGLAVPKKRRRERSDPQF
jgi:FAD binding domain-containing protein